MEREREREREVPISIHILIHPYIYLFIYIYIYTYSFIDFYDIRYINTFSYKHSPSGYVHLVYILYIHVCMDRPGCIQPMDDGIVATGAGSASAMQHDRAQKPFVVDVQARQRPGCTGISHHATRSMKFGTVTLKAWA